MKNRLIGVILALLGFSGCKDHQSDAAMYGIPPPSSVDVTITGEVLNILSKPVPGIFVTETENSGGAPLITEFDGSFSFQSTLETDRIPFTKTLLFEDADGSLNGTLEDKEVTFTFAEENRVGEGEAFELTDVKVVLTGEP